ncbi:AaceriAGL179Cp [[Ashbya] aceris (nom. inval.)]|nr:AaceriAGL179Cp [[Ashbya] aceris (nom. inval.)]
MRSRRVDTVLVKENVRLEVVYERNPFIAGEAVGLVIRLRHLGSVQAQLQLSERLQELEQARNSRQFQKNGERSSLISTLWSALSQEERFREEDAERQIEELERQKTFNQPVDLLSFYVQLVGEFWYNSEVLNARKVQHTNKLIAAPAQSSPPAGGGGSPINGLRAEPSEPIRNFVDTDTSNDAASKGDKGCVPLVVIPQTLLFGELSLRPGEVRVFHFRSAALPETLPPSYTLGDTFKILYQLQVGGIIHSQPSIDSVSFSFPLNVCSYLNEQGSQYIPELGNDPVILPVGHVKERADLQRRRSTQSTFTKHRGSINSIPDFQERFNILEKSKKHFKELLSSEKEDCSSDQLVEKLLNFQFGEEYIRNINNGSELAESFEEDQYREPQHLTMSQHRCDSLVDDKGSPKAPLQPVMDNLRKEYLVNRNGENICTISLSKLFYGVNDDIDLTIIIPPASKYKVTGVSTALELLELINPDYLANEKTKESRRYPVYEEHSVCFEGCSDIPIKLLPSRSPTSIYPNQFRTNIFQLSWTLCFKFVIVDKTESDTLVEVYKDRNGALFQAKEELQGEKFIFRVPIVVLGSSKQLGGW